MENNAENINSRSLHAKYVRPRIKARLKHMRRRRCMGHLILSCYPFGLGIG